MKKCSECGETKSLEAFHKHKISRDGLKSKCKVCRSVEARIRTVSNKEKNAANYAKWRDNNMDRIKQNNALWHAANKDRRNTDARRNYARVCAEHPATQMIDRARQRAKKLGLPFDLEVGDVLIPEQCPVLGIPIFFRRGHNGAGPNSPSLDRFDGAKGYTKDNVVVISHRANTLKNNAALIELERVVAYMKSSPMTVGMVLTACEHGYPLEHLVDMASARPTSQAFRLKPKRSKAQVPLFE